MPRPADIYNIYIACLPFAEDIALKMISALKISQDLKCVEDRELEPHDKPTDRAVLSAAFRSQVKPSIEGSCAEQW